MRTVWTMGFVAAAALSFCFPDFIVFRFTQATIWAIALLGLVLLCGVSGQFSFAQAALFGVGGSVRRSSARTRRSRSIGVCRPRC
jgi:branched-chain amino acid transport system permease protein